MKMLTPERESNIKSNWIHTREEKDELLKEIQILRKQLDIAVSCMHVLFEDKWVTNTSLKYGEGTAGECIQNALERIVFVNGTETGNE